MAKTQRMETQNYNYTWPNKSIWPTMTIHEITQPGCYVDWYSGHLYRVNPEMLEVGGTIFSCFCSNDPWLVVKISDNYLLPLDEARILAANASAKVNF
jgi:hypothetical protein